MYQIKFFYQFILALLFNYLFFLNFFYQTIKVNIQPYNLYVYNTSFWFLNKKYLIDIAISSLKYNFSMNNCLTSLICKRTE